MSGDIQELGGADSDSLVVPMPDGLRFNFLSGNQGSLMPPSPDGVEILPAVSDLKIRYYPSENISFGYLPYNHEIMAGTKTVTLPDTSKIAGIRHETSHAVMSYLSEGEQERLVDLFMRYHPQEIAQFYLKLRADPVYNEEYFHPRAGETELAKATGVGRKYVRNEFLWNGDALEEVNVTYLVDELLAYSVTRRTRKEALPDLTETDNYINSHAYKFIQGSHPEVFKEIDSHGFFNIEGTTLFRKLLSDPLYRQVSGKPL